MVQFYYIPVLKNKAKYEFCLLAQGMQFVTEAESELQPQQLQSGGGGLGTKTTKTQGFSEHKMI